MTDRPRPLRIRRYVALLDPLPLRRVSRALTKQAFKIEGCTAGGLLSALAGPQHVCAIIDPSLLSPEQIKEAIRLLERPPRVVAVYAALTPAGVQGALDFARTTGATVLFQSPEDDPVSLARAIISIPEPSFVRQLLDGIRPRLANLPARLATAVEDLFVDDATVGTPKALARRASIARRSVDRWLDRVGIESPRLLVAVPAVLRAVTLLRETDMPLRRIAQLSGYASARRLRFHLLELTGSGAGRCPRRRGCAHTRRPDGSASAARKTESDASRQEAASHAQVEILRPRPIHKNLRKGNTRR